MDELRLLGDIEISSKFIGVFVVGSCGYGTGPAILVDFVISGASSSSKSVWESGLPLGERSRTQTRLDIFLVNSYSP